MPSLIYLPCYDPLVLPCISTVALSRQPCQLVSPVRLACLWASTPWVYHNIQQYYSLASYYIPRMLGRSWFIAEPRRRVQIEFYRNHKEETKTGQTSSSNTTSYSSVLGAKCSCGLGVGFCNEGVTFAETVLSYCFEIRWNSASQEQDEHGLE